MQKLAKLVDLEEVRRGIEKAKQANSHISQNQVEPKYKCPKCKDEEGYITRNITGYEVWRDCACKAIRQVERLIKSSEIPAEFREKTFATFDLDQVSGIVREACTVAREYVQDFDRIRESRQNSMALVGRPGCGKTHLLMAVANALLQRGIETLYFPWVEGFNEIKSNLEALDERIRRLQQVKVLYIDDVFKGRIEPTPFQLEQLFAIVNERYLQNLPVLISSERDFDQMCNMDEAVGSRLWEMTKRYTVTLVGDKNLNYRLRG